MERGDVRPDGEPPRYWAGGDEPTPPPLVPPLASRRRRARVTLLGATIALVSLAGWVVLANQPERVVADVGAGTWVTITDLPPPPTDEQDTPLGHPPPPPDGRTSSDYAFLQTQSDGVSPVAYDPCRPIHFVAPDTNAPAGAHDLVVAAVAEVSAATGLQFVEDPATDESPLPARQPYQTQRYGKRWAPVLIAWVPPGQNPAFDGRAVGEGGSIALTADDGGLVYVTGQIELDAEEFAHLATDDDERTLARATVLHELGHVVGLDHSAAKDELMYPELVPGLDDFGVGDRTGLARLGQGACYPGV